MKTQREKELIVVPQILNVAQLAAYLKSEHNYDLYKDAPPVDVDHIASLLGIVVNEDSPKDLDELEIVGRITLSDAQPARVWINPLENSYAPRRRFTLAHEIGHFCMHRSADQRTFVDTKGTMNRRESYWNRHESEANNFAADLLMPASLIKSVGNEVIQRYMEENDSPKMPLDHFSTRMSGLLQVSKPAMDYRLKNLGVRGS